MTDKQIIIDGVDVSECGHYHYGKCEIDYDEWNNEIIRYNECQNNPNCYFRQLKRKEQECEELKHKVELMMDCASCKIDEYKQTLIEIKEIAEVEIECKTYEIKNDYFNEIRWKALNEHIDFTKQILQKISEVENANI